MKQLLPRAFGNCSAKKFVSKLAWASLLLCGMWIAGCGKPTGSASGPATNPTATSRSSNTVAASSATASTNEMVMHRSFFDDTSKVGKDPFFPVTVRRERIVTEGETKPPEPKVAPSSLLKVTAIWPSKTRPLAQINKVIFAPGEIGAVSVLVPDGTNTGKVHTLQVRCLEIHGNKVVISVDGEPGTKDLRMLDKP